MTAGGSSSSAGVEEGASLQTPTDLCAGASIQIPDGGEETLPEARLLPIAEGGLHAPPALSSRS
eukprot:15444939-Alexandrium_andersonii.AAC.1